MIAYIILVFLEGQDVTTPLAEALTRAAEEAVGRGATVSVRETDRGTPDQALVTLARQAGAQVVARVSWASDRRVEARLEVTVLANSRTASQALTFDETDPLPERGRALGLVLAALLRPLADPERTQTGTVTAPSALVSSPVPPPAPPPAHRWALDAAVEGGLALGGAGSGGGGSLGLRWRAFRRVGIRIGARARFGQVGEAQATLLTFAGSAGVLASLLQPRDGRRLALGVRADALLLYESLSHLSSDDPEPVRQGRLIPGASLLAEMSWSLGPAVSLFLATGPEVAFGTTHVFVRQSQVADLAPVRAVVQGGLIASF